MDNPFNIEYDPVDCLADCRALLRFAREEEKGEKTTAKSAPLPEHIGKPKIPCRSCKVEEGTLTCPCRSAKYCCKACQKEDWGRHKANCHRGTPQPPKTRPNGLPERGKFARFENGIPHATAAPFGRENFTVEEGKDMSKVMVHMAKSCVAKGKGAGQFFHSACASGYLDAVKEILELKLPGAHVDGGNGDTQFRFVLSGKHGHTDVAEYLLENGANPNIKDCEGCTALHWCAYDDQVETSRLLVRYGANVNATADSLATPLHCAAITDKAKAARFLLENGADTEALDNKGRTPLARATIKGYQSIVDLILEFEVRRREAV
jgi:hypothetical protein